MTESKTTPLDRITLRCLTPAAAQRVVDEFPNPGNRDNGMKAVESAVEIHYFDKRWPLDVANWAFERGLTSDSDSARVIRCL